MKKLLLLSLALGSLLFAQTGLNIGKISTALETEINQAPDDMLIVSLMLTDRVDITALEKRFRSSKASLSVRSATTIQALKQKAASTQQSVLAYLSTHPQVDQSFIKPFWINNVIFVRLHPDVIPDLSQRADIEWIDKNYDIELEAYEDVGEAPLMIPGGREPGLDAIRAPLMWQLGYTGKDRVVMSFDTGVDDTHPALADRHRANVVAASWSWFDPSDPTNFDPGECGDHGTHTVGTMVGVNPITNDTTGVAPQAYWIGANWCNGFGQATSTAIFQWAMDPDGDSTTTFDMPDVINNSWRHPGLTDECTSFYAGLFQSLEAVGIAVVYSAGNSGPGVSSITPPKNINQDTVDVFCVGNLNGNSPFFNIAGSSSRGPSICGGEGSLLIKPEVSAPGVSVRSTELSGTYGFKTGTSMAAPHVSGAILLLKDAFPTLTSRELKMALYTTARDLGPRGEDNIYGMGLIDVFTAYLELVADGNVPNSGTPPNLEVAVQGILAPADSFICGTGVEPIVRVKNYGTDTVTSLKIVNEYAPGIIDTLDWTGSWAPGTEMDLNLGLQTLPANPYELTSTIIEVNGGQDFFDGNNSGLIAFALADEPVLAAIADTICAGSDAVLQSQTDAPWEVQWYTQQNGGFPIGSGDQFILPNVGQDSLLYIGSGLSGVLGLADSVQNSGAFHQQTGGTLYFTLERDTRLVSLDMIVSSPGLRLIQIFKDLQANNVIQAIHTEVLDSGRNEIFMDILIPAGDYRITLAGIPGAFRQTGNVTYPIEIPGLGSITSAEPFGNSYYYFYNMRFVAENACPRETVTLTARPIDAVADFTVDNNSPELPDNATVNFTDQSSNAMSYFWDFGDSTTSTDPSPQHAYMQPGTYAVSLTVTDANGCTNTTVDSLTVTGFPTNIAASLGLEFSFYPNPGSSTLFLELTQPEGVMIEVLNVEGQQVLSRAMSPTGKLSLDMRSLADGVYLIVARKGAHQISQKWVKHTP
ncbi:MAG: S8 family serine peptidase [Bacteroidota bacterium]